MSSTLFVSVVWDDSIGSDGSSSGGAVVRSIISACDAAAGPTRIGLAFSSAMRVVHEVVVERLSNCTSMSTDSIFRRELLPEEPGAEAGSLSEPTPTSYESESPISPSRSLPTISSASAIRMPPISSTQSVPELDPMYSSNDESTLQALAPQTSLETTPCHPSSISTSTIPEQLDQGPNEPIPLISLGNPSQTSLAIKATPCVYRNLRPKFGIDFKFGFA
ncbi:hypothetical protein FN846DRAFT_330709 [Sphaerosporella brunnea]|uniref:Uncharacterized protein n=1 Tax=Sphaerosporella brunnea TaxID=1250544 RepID=A0A5J5EKI7_9PEZI|nr:hypothetical protein FN846DRAFT_330709 [Sphaerosporella brunnea]